MKKIILILMLLALVGLTAKWLIPKKEATEVRIGYLPIYVDLPLFVAQEKGFFERHGITADLKRFGASPEIGTALVNGDIQAGASVAYSVVLSTESRDPGKLKIFVVDSETPENYLSSFVVLADSGIKTMSDLKGKKIASFPGPTAITFGKMVLEKFHLDPSNDVNFFELDAGSHLDALSAKTVDALFTYEPIATQAVLEKNAIKLLAGAVESQIINPWQAGVWVISSEFATKQPREARAVMLAIYDAIDYIRSNPQDAKKSLSAYTKIKPDVAQATPTIPFAKIGEADVATLQKQTDILYEQQLVSKPIEATALMAPAAWVK